MEANFIPLLRVASCTCTAATDCWLLAFLSEWDDLLHAFLAQELLGVVWMLDCRGFGIFVQEFFFLAKSAAIGTV